MVNSDKEILADIDATIDALIENAEGLHFAKKFTDYEVEAFEKTEKSLLARLMHRQSQLESVQMKKLESIQSKEIEEYRKKSAPLWKKRHQNSAKTRKPSSKSRG